MPETSATVQAALDTAYGENVIKISKQQSIDATNEMYYATSIQEATKGKSHWCEVTIADSAADQATAIQAALATEGQNDSNIA